jgi:putative ABC transport system substrate-binding protein
MQFDRLKRREFITLLGGAAAAWPLAVHAQQAMPTIGILSGASPTPYIPVMNAIRKGLAETGFVEGRNLTIEYRWAEGLFDRLPALAAELVNWPVALIVTSGGVPPTLAAKAATTTIPIVFHMGDDPVRVGAVASINRPGGNVTGVTFLTVASGTKRLELLTALLPTAKVIGVLFNPRNPGAEPTIKDLQAAARALSLELHVAQAHSAPAFDEAMASLVQRRVGALIVIPDTIFNIHRARLAELVARHAIPAMYGGREYVEAGGLISYGASLLDSYREEGVYAGRILKGDKPADLQVLQSTRFELVLNLKTAKALNIAIPDRILALADEVID